jgi:AhpD family alkylhydroperoxidase
MATANTRAEMREMLGLVPGFFESLPEALLDSEWESFKLIELNETAIPNKYKELIGIAVSGATRCRYCAYFHTEAARLFGATDEEINEASLMAMHTMAWSTYLNAIQYDYDRFVQEVDQVTAYIEEKVATPV